MGLACHDDCSRTAQNNQPTQRYTRILWVGLIVNLTMFAVEIIAGWKGGSVSLLADAVDFFGDGVNFAASIFAMTLATVWRSRVALFKGYVMVAYGAFIMAKAAGASVYGTTPEHELMGMIGLLALVANVFVAVLLYAYREGDANMRSVWICTRNDALGNVLILIAAAGVLGTGSRWPDLAVASLMGALAISGGLSVLRRARDEIAQQKTVTLGHHHGDGHEH